MFAANEKDWYIEPLSKSKEYYFLVKYSDWQFYTELHFSNAYMYSMSVESENYSVSQKNPPWGYLTFVHFFINA